MATKDKEAKAAVPEKKEEKVEEPKDEYTLRIAYISKNLIAILRGVEDGDPRKMGRPVRSLASLRRTIESHVLQELFDEVVDHNEVYRSCISQIDVEMAEEKPSKLRGSIAHLKQAAPKRPYPLEFEAYAVLILIVALVNAKENDKAMECAKQLVSWLKTHNDRTLDEFRAKAYFYLSLAYERCGRLPEIRPELLSEYRRSCLNTNAMTQATLLNLLLRNFLSQNLYEQALKLVQKTSFPESRPNAQYARYLYYIGRIKAVQLEYSDSHSKLMQAIRKAPQGTNVALGFKLAANKLAIVVELLMGAIPYRSTFMIKEFREGLWPYYEITQAVRSGDLNAFKEKMLAHEEIFIKDKTLMLINRLRYNVIKTGLRSISHAYGRISLQDIKEKLGLASEQDTASNVAKAVVDGVIDATIDYDKQFLTSKQKYDLYSSCEPQKAFHKRIAFCLQMHNDTVKAMAYPDEDGAKDEPDERRQREKQLANVDDDDDDDMGLL